MPEATYTIIKNNANGQAELSYTGTIRNREATSICVDAIYQFSDRELGYMTLRKGDIFTEWFYSDRWYNVFRIQDKQSQALKGWYCNITRPAIITDTHVSADDLALDVFVYPDGRVLILDEDEFDALQLSEHEQHQAHAAVKTIQHLVTSRTTPFDEITTEQHP